MSRRSTHRWTLLRLRLRAAWQAFRHAHWTPQYAVVYDVPILRDGRPTGDFTEEYYELFLDPGEAHELFRTAYPTDGDKTTNARLVMILGPIDLYEGKR